MNKFYQFKRNQLDIQIQKEANKTKQAGASNKSNIILKNMEKRH